MNNQPTLDYLFPLAGSDHNTLHQALDHLRQAVEQTDNLPYLAQQYLTDFPAQDPYALAIVGSESAGLLKQIRRAETGLRQAFEQAGEWRTPAGSYFTAQPLGPRGLVAFVYPGAMNSYVGLGRDLFRLFPGLLTKLAGLTSQVSEAIRQPLTQPAKFETLNKAERQQLTDQLLADPAAMLETGTSFAILFTKIMQDYFGLQPDMAFGYSLGESSMLWSLGVWADAQAGSAALNEFPLFQHPSTWHNYALTISAETARKVIQSEPHVELSIINTANEIIIAGEPTACQRVIDQLDCSAMTLPFNLAMHCSAVEAAYPALVELYNRPIKTVPQIEFYSAANYDYLPLERETVSQAIARMLCQPLNFPRLLNRVYTAGARLFIELGPGRTCTRWIGDHLAERDHTAVAINKAGTSDRTNIIRLMARLISHRLPLNLTPLLSWCETEAQEIGLPINAAEYHQLDNHLNEVNQLQVEFLQYREQRLQELSMLIKQQLDALVGELNSFHSQSPPEQPSLPRQSLAFNEYQLKQFATGSLAECFGAAYAIYDHHRGPRIPNGDLQLIHRVVSVTVNSVVAECDLQPTNELLTGPPPAGNLPFVIYMEMALQACGFLSVYLGAALKNPQVDLYYRNLDGQATLYRLLSLNHSSVTTKAELISSTMMQGIIIEKFSFEVQERTGRIAFQGYTTFGYFNRRALANQVGLGGSLNVSWSSEVLENLPRSVYPVDHRLHLLDEVFFEPAGGHFGRGYIVGRKAIRPDDWFFKCHFYQDPVMPGSLGVEAVLQAMQWHVVANKLIRHWPFVHWSHRVSHTTKWQYRGQITPEETKLMIVEVHLKETVVTPSSVSMMGDGHVWRINADQQPLRIYTVQDAAIFVADSRSSP